LEEFGAASRTEGVETLPKSALELVETPFYSLTTPT
jgi:hypothetical protein